VLSLGFCLLRFRLFYFRVFIKVFFAGLSVGFPMYISKGNFIKPYVYSEALCAFFVYLEALCAF
jgi:hypothetical protein